MTPDLNTSSSARQNDLTGRIRLNSLLGEVAQYLGCDPSELPTARQALSQAQGARIPVTRHPTTGFYEVERAHIPQIAELWNPARRGSASPRVAAPRALDRATA